ncbi:MAG: rRNA maturation RNase YbeY [Candidatus Omnitrophota bacterium]
MDITVKNLQSKILIPSSRIQSIALKACGYLRLPKSKFEISITFVGQQRMRKINKTYLNHDFVTDVITFDLIETAEIVICPFEAQKNAKIYGVSNEGELILYVVHGLLHLAGYDDHAPEDIKRMRSKEKEILERFA